MERSRELRDLIYNRCGKGYSKKIGQWSLTDDEFGEFLHVADRAGLDPLARQIHVIPMGADSAKSRRLCIIAGVDGLLIFVNV